MSDNRELPSRQYGVGDDSLYGDAAHDPLDGGSGHDLLQRRSACPKGMSARLSRLLHVSIRSASRGWRSAVCALVALAAALALSFATGTSAAEGTLPTVSVSDAEAYEDGTRISFEVSLSQPSRERVTVEVATSSGTATSGADFRAVSRTVIFPAHSREPQLVLVKLRDDQTREPDETFTVTLTNPVGATLGDATATGTIRNDDTVATLTASGIGETSATLKIGGYTDGWWYEGGDYSTGIGYNGQAWRIYRRNVHPCTAVAAGTTAVSIGGLTSAMPYDYRAYSDSACSTRLAKVRFQTLAPEGTPTVSVSDAEVSEDGAWMDFTVSLSQGSRERVTVRVHTSSGTATSGADFRAVSRTLTFPANDRTPLSVRVFVHDDEELEPDEVFAVTLTNPVGATLGDATATGTIRDDGDTAATLAASDIEDATATLTITGHADGWWYMGNAHACTAVAAGTTSVSISGLTTVTDYEYAAYSDSACGTRLARTKFKTLAPEGTPTVSISDAEVSEGGYVTFAVSLSHPSRERVTVEVHTSSGTATSGFDFRAGPQTLTFHANSSRITKYARVEVLDDEEPEPDETFTATLRVPVGATLGDATATGTIRDDGDTAATLTASDIEDTTATLTIAGHTNSWWYGGGNAELCTAVAAGTTAVNISGLTTVTDYEFTAYSDSACSTRLARTKFTTLAPEGTPTVSISDAEAYEDGTWIDFKVSLSHPSRKRVFVRTDTSDGTARGTHGDFAPGIDFRHEFSGMGVIFEANSPVTTRSRSVRVFDDQEPEPDETFTVTLTHPKNVTLGDATATGTIRDDGDTAARLTASDIEDTTATLTISGHTDGWWYKGDEHSCTAVSAGTTAVSIGGLTTVSDYDYTAYSDSTCSTKLARVKFKTIAPEGTPTVSVSDAAASEDGSWIRFKVSLSHPSREPVTVWYETSGGTATSGTDFRADSGTVTLSANSWDFNPPVSVIVHDDQEPESDETFTLTLTRATGATLGDATATGTIVDDGDTATTLTAGDIEDTTATLTISGHTDAWWYKGNAHACTAVAAGTTAVSIGGLAAVTDYEYTAYSDSTCSTKLANVEFRTLAPEGTPTVSVSDAEAYEDGYSVDFEVSLSHPSREEVTVEFATSSGSATKGTDFRGGSGSLTLTFPPNRKDPRRVAVRVIHDQVIEPDETFTVTLTNPVGATLGDATATGTIRNDDTVATLVVSDIEDTTATLTISGHSDGWWHQGHDWFAINSPCTAVAAGTTAVSIDDLKAAMDHEYRAYSDSTCTTRLAKVRFRTLASEGTPTVSVSDAEVSEDGGSMEFWVSLSQPSREEVTVYYRTSDGTATSGTDFEAQSGTLTFPANSRYPQSVYVNVHDDQAIEPDETITLTLSNPVGATLGDATATGTIVDDGDTAATLTASDIEETTATLTIAGHTDGWWYKGKAHACTAVAAGTTAVSISGLTTVTTYKYTAYSDSGCSTKLAKVRFHTLAPAGTPTVSVSDGEGSEDGGRIRFEVSLSQPSREKVSVWLVASDGTATGGTGPGVGHDFDSYRPILVRFGANSSETTRRVGVKVYDDQEPEPDETFTVTLTNPTGATLGDATATGTIRDDGDTSARLTASDIEDTTAMLTISGHTDAWWYRGNAHGCTAVAAGTTAANIGGLTALKTHEYGAYSDSRCQTKLAKMEFRTIAPEGTPTVSVSDAQVSEDGSWMEFRVSLSQPSREPVTVWFETSGGTATGGTDFDAGAQRVHFDANSSEITRHANVRVIDDQEPEPDETFTVTLTRATGATLGDATATGTIVDDGDTATTLMPSDIEDTTATLTISGHTDGWWYKGNAHACTAVAAGTTAVSIGGLAAVTDYEYTAYSDSACSTKLANVEFRTLAPEGTPTVSVSDAEVSEDGTRVFFLVSLSHPSREQVTVDVHTSGGTATSGTDFEAVSQTLTFPANSGEPELVPVLVHDDQEPEPDETFTVTLTNPTGATLGDGTATGTIKDNGDTAATAVALVSDPGDDATYAEDDTVQVTVTFPKAVAVDTAGGTPRLKLDLDPADGGERWAVYAGGSGTNALTFAYTVATGDVSNGGVAVLADTLELDGGTIRSAAGQADTALGHPGLAADAAHKVDAEPPRLLRGEIDGGTVTLTFSETLDPESTGGRFLMGIQTSETASLGCSAKGAVSVDGETVTFGLGKYCPPARAGLTERNRLTYFRRADGADGSFRDLAGNLLAPDGDAGIGLYVQIDLVNVTGTGSSVTGVAVVSDPGDDDTYGLGETIRVRLTFGEAVTVDTAGGTPRMKIRMNLTWGEKWAAYEGGSGTNALTFAYTVRPVNATPHGVAVLANTLELDGGAIASAATGTAANLAHAGLGHDPEHKVDYRLSPPAADAAPAVAGVAVVSDPGDDDTYGAGEAIRVRLTFGEAVTVDTAGGTPRMKIRMNLTWGEKWAAYEGGSGTNALTFAYTVRPVNATPHGVAVLANTLQLNGGAIASVATGANANLAHAGLGHDSAHKVDWRLSPPGAVGTAANAAPAVTGVAVVSDAGADDTYMLGETIRVRLAFGETVNVSGTPRMKIKMDPRWGEKWAAYESGSGTAALTFAWTVVEPNYAPQGIAVLANTLQLNGGTVRSAAGTDAALGHAGLGHDGTHKVDWRPALSVADARANEGAAAVEFEVSLNRTFSGTAHRVTVNYATADGTAKAGEDYTATSGSLTFAAGERVKTVRVPLLDDAIDEGEETFTFRLSNARGARISDGEATGTIANADPLQKMWLSRFGRTVASHVTDAVSDRLANPLAGAQVTVGGQRVDLARAGDEAWPGEALTSVARALGAPNGSEDDPGSLSSGSGPGQADGWRGTGLGRVQTATPGGTTTRDLSGRELLLGSAFHLAKEGEGGRPGLAAWGRVTVGGFDGEAPADDGSVRIDGDVTTGILGADAEWNRLLAGVAVSVSEGKGTFDQPGVDLRQDREHDDHGEPLCAVCAQRPAFGLGPGRLGHGRHDHRPGREREPARAGDPDRPRDAPCRHRREGRAHGGRRGRRHRPRAQGGRVLRRDRGGAGLERGQHDGGCEPGAAGARRQPRVQDGRRRHLHAGPGDRASP